MSESAKKQVTIDQLGGFKQLRHVATLLSSLHEAGCGRDKARNRELHFDDYVLLILLYLFNPLIDSMEQVKRDSHLFPRRITGDANHSVLSFSAPADGWSHQRRHCSYSSRHSRRATSFSPSGTSIAGSRVPGAISLGTLFYCCVYRHGLPMCLDRTEYHD